MSANEKKSFWSELHDGCAAIREVAIVTAIVLLLVAPQSIHSILDRAGVTSVAGVQFNVGAIEEANQQTHDAALEVEYVKTQLESIEAELRRYADVNRSPSMQALAKSVSGLEEKLDHAKGNLGRAASTVQQSVPEKYRRRLTPPEVLFKDVNSKTSETAPARTSNLPRLSTGPQR